MVSIKSNMTTLNLLYIQSIYCLFKSQGNLYLFKYKYNNMIHYQSYRIVKNKNHLSAIYCYIIYYIKTFNIFYKH